MMTIKTAVGTVVVLALLIPTLSEAQTRAGVRVDGTRRARPQRVGETRVNQR